MPENELNGAIPMSMKRARAKSAGTGRSTGEEESPFFASKTPKEAEKTWAEQTEGKPDSVYVMYSMVSRYTKGQLVVHTKFGKGVVVGVEPQRVEVLFEDGIRRSSVTWISGG